MIVDVVVQTKVFQLAEKDTDLKDGLTIEILQRLVALNVQLDNNFALLESIYVSPLVMNPEQKKIEVVPVLNMTEFEKGCYCFSFLGKLFKQGHRYKTWKERLFYLTDSTMHYFDLKMTFQGEFACEECSVESVPHSECTAPKNTFPIKLTNYSAGGEFLYCYTQDSVFQELLSLMVTLKLAHFYAIKSLINIPPLKRGFMKKQGHLIRNWKSRFFILNYGILSYYEKDGVTSASGVQEAPKGKVELQYASVAVTLTDDNGKPLPEDDHRLCITVSTTGTASSGRESFIRRDSTTGNGSAKSTAQPSSNDYKLVLQVKTLQEKKDWLEALRRHIEYAKDFLASE
jgi:hypothetical protein